MEKGEEGIDLLRCREEPIKGDREGPAERWKRVGKESTC